MILLKHVLVATDFGETSDAALTYGRALARAFGASLHVLHAVDDVAAVAIAARKRLDAILTHDDRTRLHGQAVLRTSTSPAAAIVDYAKAAHVDLVVVGTHGRGPVSHFFMGSVAEKVVRTAPCPVLAVRPNEHEFIVPDQVARYFA